MATDLRYDNAARTRSTSSGRVICSKISISRAVGLIDCKIDLSSWPFLPMQRNNATASSREFPSVHSRPSSRFRRFAIHARVRARSAALQRQSRWPRGFSGTGHLFLRQRLRLNFAQSSTRAAWSVVNKVTLGALRRSSHRRTFSTSSASHFRVNLRLCGSHAGTGQPFLIHLKMATRLTLKNCAISRVFIGFSSIGTLTSPLKQKQERTVADEASDFNLQLWQRCEI
jgi:hypothetical protein